MKTLAIGAFVLLCACNGQAQRTVQSFASAAPVLKNVATEANKMRLNPRVKELALEAKVEAAIVAQTGVNALHISVHASGETVTLAGTVPNMKIKETAVRTASKVGGVSIVLDRLRVQK